MQPSLFILSLLATFAADSEMLNDSQSWKLLYSVTTVLLSLIIRICGGESCYMCSPGGGLEDNPLPLVFKCHGPVVVSNSCPHTSYSSLDDFIQKLHADDEKQQEKETIWNNGTRPKGLRDSSYLNGPPQSVVFLGVETLPSGDGLTEHNLPLLRGLTFNGDGLKSLSLPEHVFDQLPKLQSLRFWGNKLTTIPGHIFDKQTQLLELDLCGNELISLPSGVFDYLGSLEHLALCRNPFIDLPEKLFDKLTSLKSFSLGDNKILSYPPSFFRTLTNLEVSELLPAPDGSSKLLDVHSSCPTGSTLMTYSVNNAVAFPPHCERNIPCKVGCKVGQDTTGTLVCSGAVFAFDAYPPTGYAGFCNSFTKVLDLSNTRMSSLPPSAFDDLSSLEELSLEFNNIACYPVGMFDKLSISVKKINIDAQTTCPSGCDFVAETNTPAGLKVPPHCEGTPTNSGDQPTQPGSPFPVNPGTTTPSTAKGTAKSPGDRASSSNTGIAWTTWATVGGGFSFLILVVLALGLYVVKLRGIINHISTDNNGYVRHESLDGQVGNDPLNSPTGIFLMIKFEALCLLTKPLSGFIVKELLSLLSEATVKVGHVDTELQRDEEMANYIASQSQSGDLKFHQRKNYKEGSGRPHCIADCVDLARMFLGPVTYKHCTTLEALDIEASLQLMRNIHRLRARLETHEIVKDITEFLKHIYRIRNSTMHQMVITEAEFKKELSMLSVFAQLIPSKYFTATTQKEVVALLNKGIKAINFNELKKIETEFLRSVKESDGTVVANNSSGNSSSTEDGKVTGIAHTRVPGASYSETDLRNLRRDNTNLFRKLAELEARNLAVEEAIMALTRRGDDDNIGKDAAV
jgi:Leucine-rich repeat (LRR) protein